MHANCDDEGLNLKTLKYFEMLELEVRGMLFNFQSKNWFVEV